jgi:hypothetical protein
MYDEILDRARTLAATYLSAADARHVGTCVSRNGLRAILGGPFPAESTSAITVIEGLAAAADPGIVATVGPRYFGFVTGGVHPAALAADWLVSAWDQNLCLYVRSPAASVIEDVAASWILEALPFPADASVGFTTGAQMANMTGLAAARHDVLRCAGWDVEAQSLQGAPRVHVIVGAEAIPRSSPHCASSGLARARFVASPPTNRDACVRMRSPTSSVRVTVRRSSARRRATSARVLLILFLRSPPPPARTARGCTSTAHSAFGRRRLRHADIS